MEIRINVGGAAAACAAGLAVGFVAFHAVGGMAVQGLINGMACDIFNQSNGCYARAYAPFAATLLLGAIATGGAVYKTYQAFSNSDPVRAA